ncbi:uncharacterized protein LOC130642310 [Hydractinia symbiolongicarpus]|uniref:uncharacterized protein LOC130642310 n=1 Tax=Hydractinia symbiolongicarpus TaxID=13093 RepID=UPI00254B0264|nr:uncharacterized protein LOC130642310 [Hydractinia symbiolongicarpus]
MNSISYNNTPSFSVYMLLSQTLCFFTIHILQTPIYKGTSLMRKDITDKKLLWKGWTNFVPPNNHICVHCGEKSGNRKRVCPCGNIFDIRKKTLQERIHSGQTSLCTERYFSFQKQEFCMLTETSLMIGMKEKHYWDSFVIYAKKRERNMMLDTLATPGFSAEFFGEKGNRT